jgi:hypothetical protein
MAFTGNFLCTSFKKEVLEGLHDFNVGANTYKLALYDNNASFTAATTVYTATNEVSGTGYSAGGGTLTNIDPTTSGTTAFIDFADLTFSTATITARGALIYNSTNGNRTAQFACWILVRIKRQQQGTLRLCSQQRTQVTPLFG